MSQLIYFDLDDTLLDHASAEEHAQRETFESNAPHFGGVAFAEWIPRYREVNRALWDSYARGEVTGEALRVERFAATLTALGLDTAGAASLSKAYLACYANHWRLNEGAEEILAAASNHGTVGLLSNGFREIQRAKIERFALTRFVSHVVLSEEVGAMKPAREIFDAAVALAGGNGDGARVRKVYIGDSFATDVVGAKNAGWLPVLYNPSGAPPPAPVLFVTRLSDLKPLLE